MSSVYPDYSSNNDIKCKYGETFNSEPRSTNTRVMTSKIVSEYDQELPQSQTNFATHESQILQVVCAAEQVGLGVT